MTKLFFDVGHGGTDGGAQGNGLSEKVLTLKIAQKCQKLLADYENVQVMLSRTSDKTLSLDERVKLAEKWGADFFISIHINSATNATATGFESFIYNGPIQNATPALQNVMHENIMKKISGVRDRGKKRANFHVLRESHCPALLTENLFISNSSDAKKLATDTFLTQLAAGHVAGLEAFLGLKKKARAPITKPAPSTSKLYKVQIGAYSVRENAEQMEKQAEAKGFSAFITKDGDLYKVQVGAYAELDNAEAQLSKVKAAGFSAFIVVE